MKIRISPKRLFVAAFLLVVIVNVIVLGGVYYNRSAKPQALVLLTEREIRLSYNRNTENSGLSLHVVWRTYQKNADYTYYSNGSPDWFDEEKLSQLGFDTERYKRSIADYTDHFRPLPKKVFLVLENNSPLHDRALADAEAELETAKKSYAGNPDDNDLKYRMERAEKNWHSEQVARSRLFVVDAGRDVTRLRQQYSDEKRYIIAPGIVRMTRVTIDKADVLRGFVVNLAVERIHLPLSLRQEFEPFLMNSVRYWESEEEPRYQVQLAYGRKYEPWIISVEPFEK